MEEGVASVVIPPFLFHYIIIIVCIMFIMCVCVLKFKYLYWYSQPLTFRFTIRRLGGSGGTNGRRTQSSIMNPLSLGERCYNAVVYPFLNNVNHRSVRVYAGGIVCDAPFERIAAFLSRPETEIMTPGRRGGGKMNSEICISEDTLRLIMAQDTFGLSGFIGVLNDSTMRGGDDVIRGVSILTPRIMLSFDSSSTSVHYRSVSIYVCDYLAWERYTVSDRESLELIETTEYIQKSREIAGEQTLYRYREIPWFVIPFSTVYSYTFSISASAAAPPSYIGGAGMSVIPVSSSNFALFYSFVNECSRDFRCCIFNEITQLQSLVDNGLYRIYMLVLNQVRVVAVYLFAPSWMKMIRSPPHTAAAKTKNKTRTSGNRISELHEHISNTSTALVKYIPPVIRPRYDAFGKRVATSTSTSTNATTDDESILLLMSSIQHKTLCDKRDFVYGFHLSAARMVASNDSVRKNNPAKCIMIDTLAHNYRLIDDIITSSSSCWRLLTQDKWYYILYNAIIHEQLLCKDILII
jgi:hypothetical protein